LLIAALTLTPPCPRSLQETYEAKRKEFLGDLQRKEEDMRQMFVSKVKETEAELKEKEREVCLKSNLFIFILFWHFGILAFYFGIAGSSAIGRNLQPHH